LPGSAVSARIDREAVAAELLDLLDEVEAEEERARESSQRHKKRIEQLKGQAKERRDVLAGKKGVQLQLPIAAAVLAEAREAAKARKGDT